MIYETIMGTFANEDFNKDMKGSFYEGVNSTLETLQHIEDSGSRSGFQDNEWCVFAADGNGIVCGVTKLECLQKYYKLIGE